MLAAQHRGRMKISMLADEADNPGFLLLLEQVICHNSAVLLYCTGQAERELRTSRPHIARVYLDK